MQLSKRKSSTGEDRISSLPDCILTHILSFLPICDAVRTSILSKSWILVWTSLTKLEFDVFSTFPPKKLERFLSAKLFSWNNLQYLTIHINCTFRVPSSYNTLPNLQCLKISRIKFVNEFTDPILNFPVLKEFHANQCIWNYLTIQAPLLESFYLKFLNYNFTSKSILQETLNIRTSLLKKFSYRGHLLENINFLDPSLVVEADADIYLQDCRPVISCWESLSKLCSHRANLLLKYVHEVKSLKLTFDEVHYLPGSLPIFERLTYLKLEGPTTSAALFEFLHKSPMLNTIVFKHKQGSSLTGKEYNSLNTVMVPRYIKSSLRVVEIKDFEANDIGLARFFMEKAVLLEKMIISATVLPCQLVEMEMIKQQLLSHPKCSSASAFVLDFSTFIREPAINSNRDYELLNLLDASLV